MKKILFFLFLLLSVHVLACDCPPPEPVSKELCNKYDVIFYGRIDSVASCAADGIGTVYFTVISLYKGSVEQHASLGYDCKTSCLMSFAPGEEWIIYGIYQGFNQVTVSLCSPSRKRVAEGTVDYYEAGSHRTFGQESTFLMATLGIQPYAQHNRLNDQQKEMAPHNEQPSAMGKLWLLLISLGTMIIVYIVSKKMRNGK